MIRSNLKRALRSLALVFVSPLIVFFHALRLLVDQDELLASMSQLLSLFPGKSGGYLRSAFYRFALSRCSQDAVISFGTVFSQRKTEISSGVYIGPQGNIGSCRIGRDCLIGSGVHILSGKQQHSIDRLDVPVKEQGGQLTQICIGEDTWIGNGAIIMADVGPHCVIGAGSVANSLAPSGEH